MARIQVQSINPYTGGGGGGGGGRRGGRGKGKGGTVVSWGGIVSWGHTYTVIPQARAERARRIYSATLTLHPIALTLIPDLCQPKKGTLTSHRTILGENTAAWERAICLCNFIALMAMKFNVQMQYMYVRFITG